MQVVLRRTYKHGSIAKNMNKQYMKGVKTEKGLLKIDGS